MKAETPRRSGPGRRARRRAAAPAARGRRPPPARRKSPGSATHSSIEPSWLPQTPENLVDRRHRAVRILGDVEHREIGGQMRPRQRGEASGDERELRRAPRSSRRPSAPRSPRRAPTNGALAWTSASASASISAKCPTSTIMVWRSPSCQRPCFFSASTTSRGM